MDHVMKLLMKCCKRLAFERMVGRTHQTNQGWVPGHGALDAALLCDNVMGQARELRHPLFVLYLDLATFFPAIKRQNRRLAEWYNGLPEEVAELSKEIMEGMQARFDTEHGLGSWFEILGGSVGISEIPVGRPYYG